MKTMMVLAAILCGNQDEAVKTFHEALKGASEEERIEAAREALGTVHEKVIKTVGKLIHTDTEKVRVDVARAIGKVDHPSSVDVLVKALSRHRKTPGVLGAIARGLGDLDLVEPKNHGPDGDLTRREKALQFPARGKTPDRPAPRLHDRGTIILIRHNNQRRDPLSR